MLVPWVRKKLQSDPKRLGRWGQNRAEQYLRRRSHRTIARNFSFRGGELDLVMADAGGTLVFVEVKTRQNEDYLPARTAVTYKKQQKISRTAKCFLKQFKISDRPLRFDIITVILPEKGRPLIQHYPNAFRP